jgi:hypothetical protein
MTRVAQLSLRQDGSLLSVADFASPWGKDAHEAAPAADADSVDFERR